MDPGSVSQGVQGCPSPGMAERGDMEKWNILWADDDTWLPPDANVLTRERLPHGFHKVIIHETDEDYLQVWVEVAGRGFYPFAAESRHYGYACWANSRRFAIVA